MFKLCVFLALVAVAVAAPAPEPAPAPGLIAAYAPVAAPIASSSSYINRNYNALHAAPLAYPAPLAYGAAYAAPYAGHIIY